jgi:hypothetical protein
MNINEKKILEEVIENVMIDGEKCHGDCSYLSKLDVDRNELMGFCNLFNSEDNNLKNADWYSWNRCEKCLACFS